MPCGRTGGAAQLGRTQLGNWFTRTIKSGDMMVGAFNKDLGYARPGVYPDAPTPASEAFTKALPAPPQAAAVTSAPVTGGGGAAPLAVAT